MREFPKVRCSMRTILIVWLLVSFASFEAAYPNDKPLPSLNYWELSADLIHSLDLQKQLQVSQVQITAINRMRGKEEFASLFAEGRKKLAAIGKDVPVFGSALSEFYFSFDNVVYRELATILTEQQLTELRKIRFRERFPNGYDAFRNEEVLCICGIDSETKSRLKIMVELEVKEFAEFRNHSRQNSISEVLGNLPYKTQRLFVHFGGNKYIPGIEIENDFPTKSIPFPPRTRSASFLTFIYGNQTVHSSIGLNEGQVKKLSEIYDRCMEGIAAYGRSKGTTFQDNLKGHTDTALKAMEAVISPSQILMAKRLYAMSEFEQDFAVPFSRQEFLTYLELSPNDSDAIKSVSSIEFAELNSVLLNRNQQIFNRLLKSLPAKNHDKMELLFRDIW